MNGSAINLAIDPSTNEESKANVHINTEDVSAVRDDSHSSLWRELKYGAKYQERAEMSPSAILGRILRKLFDGCNIFYDGALKVLWCLSCSWAAADNLPLHHKYTDAPSFVGFVVVFQMQMGCEGTCEWEMV